MPISQETTLKRVRVIKALAHPSRLAIIERLAIGECCVCELRQLIGDDISTVSKHLALLKSARLISADKRGVQVFYRLEIPCITDFFSCVDKILSQKT